MTDTMQERAAKVCEDLAKEYDADAKRMSGQIVLARADQGATTAIRLAMMIRALSPDPTRAALEECVRAMETILRLIPDGDDLEKERVIVTAMERCEKAIATARNALEGK